MKEKYCPECGSAYDETGRCPNENCVNHNAKTSARSKVTAEIPEMKKRFVFAEKGKQIVPDCIQSDQDETPIKQYDIARLQTLIKGAFAEGRLQVTNKRVIFRAVGFSLFGPSTLQHEFSLEEIAGIEIRKEARFNFFLTLALVVLSGLIFTILNPLFAYFYKVKFIGVLFSLVLMVAGPVLFCFFKNKRVLRHIVLSALVAALPVASLAAGALTGGANFAYKVAAGVVGLAYMISLFLLAFSPNMVLNIKTKGGTPSVEIRRKDSLFSFHHNEYTGFSRVLPGPDTDLAIHELGAVIREVQQTGTYQSN